MNLPKISIVTPSFNQAEFLEETIVSVISQNYPQLEYIVMDGGSTDGSVEIIKKYQKHISYWETIPDRGHAHALNKGFARSTGEVMAWINSDDKYFPWTFATIGEIYAQFPDILWTTGLHANFDRRGVLKGGASNVRAIYKNVYSYLFKDFHIQQESVFWHRKLWEMSGGYIDEGRKLMVDTELWCRFFIYTNLWHIDQVMGGYRSYGENRAHDATRVIQMQDDLDTSVSRLQKNLPPDIRQVADYIMQYKNDVQAHYEIIGRISQRIRRNKLLQWLPQLYYDRVCNYLYRQAIEKEKVVVPGRPVHSSLVFKILQRIDDCWVQSEIPYEF